MKTRRIAQTTGRTFSKSGQIKETSSKVRRVREQCPQPGTLLQFYALRNSVILPSMLLTSNHNESS